MKSAIKRWLNFLMAIAALAVAVECASAQSRVTGIDVSAWQGDLSQTAWNTFSSNGNIKFAFIRSSRGGTFGFYNQSDNAAADPNKFRLNSLSARYDDPRYANNISRATAAGILAGSYHFGRMDIPSFTLDGQLITNTGTDEANHMLQQARYYMKPGYLLPVFDYEAGSGSHTVLGNFGIAFSNRINEVVGFRPAIYIGNSYASGLNSLAIAADIVNAYPVLWQPRWPTSPNTATGNISDYTSTIYGPWDNFGITHPWHFWQYTDSGSVPGYSGALDMDVAHGTIEYVKDHLVPALWTNDSSGAWSTTANWNSDNRDYSAGDVSKGPAPRLPGAATTGVNDTVILDRPTANITVTHGSGTTTNIRKLYVKEALNITGGSLTVNLDPTTTDAKGSLDGSGNPTGVVQGYWAPGTWTPNVSAQFSNAVSLSGNANVSVHTLLVDAAGTFTLNGGTLTFNTIKMANPGKIVMGSPTTFTPLNNATATIGDGTGGSVDLGNASRTFIVSNGSAATDLLVAAPLTGTGGGLTKTGAGAMSLTGVSTFTGSVGVNQGSLTLSAGGRAASANSYAIHGGATLQLDNGAANNNDRIAAAPITLHGGTLGFVGNSTTETTGNLSAATGASTIALSGSGTSTLAFGSFSRSSGATVNFTGADSAHLATFSSGVTAGNFVDQGTFVNGGDYAVYNGGPAYLRAMTVGAGANDYSTSIALDRHVKLSASASGVGSNAIKTLNLTGATVGVDLLAANTLTLSNGGVIKSGGGLGSITGAGASLTSGAEYVFNTVAAGDELAVAVAIGGGTGLTKTGTGVLTLSNTANNYAGTTSIAQGTLKLGAANVIPNGSNIVVGSGAALNMNTFSETLGNLTLYDGTISSAGTLTLNGSSASVTYSGVATGATISTTNLLLGTSAGTATFNVADGLAASDLTVSSVMQDGAGTMGLTKSGVGTLQLTGNNSFTGAVSINAGTLSVTSINSTPAANQPLGNSAAAITLGSTSAAALQYTGGGSATLNRAITVGGDGGGTIRSTVGTLTVAGGINGAGNPVTLDGAGGAISVSGVISGTGTTLTKTGASLVSLSGVNTYTGNTIINEGLLLYTTSANLGNSVNIVFGGGSLRTLSSLTEARNVTLNAAGGTIDTSSSAPIFAGVISGSGPLTKTGGGTLTLSNANIYAGLTSINAGTLAVTGSIAAGSKVEVNAGGTLSGTGSVLGNAQVLGTGIINLSGAGNIAGILTAHGGNWNGGGTVGGVVSVVGGSFTVGNGANLTAPAGVSVDGGTLAGNGTVTGNVTLANNTISYSTVNFGSSGNITGTLGVNGGRAVWAGSGSVAGATTVSSGTLYVNGTLGGAGGLTLASGANLHGLGTINKTVTLSGNNRVGGQIHQHPVGAGTSGVGPSLGTLTIAAPVTWGAANLFIAGGPVSTQGDTISGNLTIEIPFDSFKGYHLNYAVSLGGTNTANITTTGSLSGNGTVTKPVTITGNGKINLSSPAVFPATVTGPVQSSVLTSTLTATGGNWNGQGSVSGLTSVTSGTFNLGAGANLTANGNMTISGTGAIAGTGKITGSVTYTSSAATVFGGTIAGSAKTLTVNSTTGGSLTLAGGANTFTGLTTINNGILKVTGNDQLGTAGVVTNMTVVTPGSAGSGHGGTLRLSGNVSYNLPITIGGGGLNGVSITAPGNTAALDNESGNNTWSGVVTLAGTGGSGTDPLLNQIGAQAGSLRVSGVIQNMTGIGATWAKTGNGDVILSGASANTYSGLTRLFGGRLIVEKDGALGTAGSGSGTTGNTFQLSGSASTLAFRGPSGGGFSYNTFEVINTHGTGSPGFGQVDNLDGDNTFAGRIAFDGPASGGARQASIGVTAGSLHLTGGLYARGSDGTPRHITKLGGGTLKLSGNGSVVTGDALVVPLASSTFSIAAGTVETHGPTATTTNLPGVTTWNVNAGGTLNAASGRFITSTVNVNATGQFNLTGGSLSVGTFNGNLNNTGGSVTPGNSPGSTAITGNYTQHASGSMQIEIGGASPGTEFDSLTVSGIATLNGTLDVSLLGGFVPAGNQQFVVLTAGNIIDNGLELTGAAASAFDLIVGSSTVVLKAISTGITGDFNDDGVVDAADYVVWRHAESGATLPHDDTPGVVDESDYEDWGANFGTESGGGSGVALNGGSDAESGLGSVPEPSSLALVAIALGLLHLRRPGLFWEARDRHSA